MIREALRKHKVPASFFLTGNFYSNPAFASLIRKLKRDRHYLGAHSDKHLLYADWIKRDSLLISREEFRTDLNNNYRRMAAFGIKKRDAVYFLPPFEWYNRTIADWTAEMGFKLINFSPGTRSTADYTFPEMGKLYRSSNEIFHSVISRDDTDPNGLNGFILLMHIGTDPRRTDKFYNRIDELLGELKKRGYSFVSLKQI